MKSSNILFRCFPANYLKINLPHVFRNILDQHPKNNFPVRFEKISQLLLLSNHPLLSVHISTCPVFLFYISCFNKEQMLFLLFKTNKIKNFIINQWTQCFNQVSCWYVFTVSTITMTPERYSAKCNADIIMCMLNKQHNKP